MNSTHVGESSRPARYRGSVRGLTQALSCLALLFSLAVSAAPVSIEQARLAVSQFVQAAPTPLGANLAAATRGGTVGEALAIGATRSASAYAYVVALQPEGYVVVSADDRLEPIIAFSASGTFDASMQNPLAYLLAQDLPNRLAAVAAAATRGAELATQIAANQADWAKLTAAEGTRAAGAQVVTEMWVDSFVQSRWSQGTEGGRACYNYYTPLIGETSHTFDPGNPDNIVSGCAATATAQMIRYFAWPEAGIGYKTGGGSVTYHDEFANPEGASLAGTQLRGGNGNGGPYDWAAMTLDPNGTESEHSLQQVGALCFDAGLALNMKYNIERSNMSGTNFSSGAFTGKFNYSGAGSAGGISGMRANLDARRPVAITIGMTNPLLPPPGGGHAIVGDGYGRIDGRWYYHFNMGWGGGGDLWYNVEEYYYDSVAGGTEWAGLGASVGNVYRKALQVNEDAASGKIISGRVTDAAGNPVPGVAVKLTDGGGDFLDMLVWNENGRNTTDENGIWAVDKVPAGDYDIVMTKDGLAFAGPKEVTVGAGNQWGLNFIATDDTGPGELVLENWYYDYDNFVAGAALVILEFNRPVGNVAVDPTSLTLHSGAGSLTLTDGVVFQSAGSPLVVILLDPVDAAVIVPWGGVSLTLDMARDFLTVDVDGEGSQGGEDEANVIPVAPLVTGLAENPGFPINPAQPLVASTKLLVDGAVLGAGANPYATKESPVQFLVTFSQPVMGVDADDFSLRLTKDFVNISTWPFEELAAKRDTPLPSAAITSVDATDATGTPATSPSQFWTVTVNMGTGDGFVRLDVIDNDTITHDDGTRALVPLGGPGVNNGDFFYSEFAYRYDNLGPVIVAATLAADNTYVDITWNEPVGSTNSLAKTSNFSDIVSQYAWGDTNGTAGHDANDALWLDRSGTMDNTFRKREDVVLMEPPFTAGLADGQARTGQFKYIQASGIPFLGTATIARVCYVELDGVAGCSEGDGLFLDVGEAGFGIVFDDTFTPGQDLWFWPSGTEPAGITAGTLVPDRTSYYAENGAIPVPDYADALDEYVAWILDFYASANNGIWLDYGPADQTYTIGNINDGFVDTLVMGVAPTDGDAGTALPADAMYRDTNQNGLVDDTDLTWLDTGAMADALDGGDTRLDDNGEALPGALFTHSLQVILRKNGGTVTSVGISRILNGDGTPMTDASNVTRAMLKFTPEQDLGGTAPGQLNEHRIPAGIETIAIVPIADNVFDALGNAADTQTSTGEMRLHDSGVPRIIDVILADDNYSAKVVFSERVYTNGNGISNHSVASVPDRVGNLTAGDFTVTTNTGAVTVTSFSNSLATNYCILTFGGTAAGRQLVDPAANLARTTLTVSVSANAIYDFAGNAVPATVWPVALRRRYNIDNPDTLPPRCFTNGDNAYRKEPTGPTPAESSTVTDAAGLTYHGIYYRDLDGDCRVDTVDLNFRNPRPNSAQSPNLSVGAASASSKFRVWVQNNDPEDTSNAAADENLANVPDTNFTGTLPWPASADWTNVTVTGASVLSTSTYYSTIRVTINQTQVRPRTHGRRWIMISYNDPDDRMDGIPPTTSANTTYEADGVHWLYVTPTPSGGTDPADWYWILGDFPPTMAWDAAPARPVAATMWRTTNYNKSGEASSYNSYDYMDVVFSEPLSSVGDGGWMPGASYGSGTNVHEKEGPFGPEILDLLSGTAQTVRIWFDSTSVTSRTFGGGSASSYAQVVDAAGYRNPTPRFTGTTLGVRNLDSRYGVLGFSNDSAWVDMLAVDSSGASIQQYSSDSNSSTAASHTLNANRVTLRAYDQGGFNANSDARWRQSNTGASYLLAGIRSQSLANTNANIVFSAATNEGSVNPGDGFVTGITELRVRNTSLTSSPEIPGMVSNGIFAMMPPAVVAAGPVYCMAKVSASYYNGTSRLDERERAMLELDVAGRTTDRIETITVRVIDTSYGQFDPEVDLLPLADDATSGMRLFSGTTGLVQLAAGGLEWSDWRINAEGQRYREVVLRPLAALSVPQTDLGTDAGPEYEVRVATSGNFNLGDSFIVEIPDDGILFRRRGSQDDFPSNWAIADGTAGLTFTGHVYRDVNGDGRWGMGETIMDIEDSYSPVPFYDAGVPYQHRTQTVPLLSVVGEFQRNLYYAKRGSAPNPDTDPEPPGAVGGTTDTDYNVVYSPGDAVWYDIGGTLGVYDAGVDIPLFSNSDLFRAPLSPHEEGARSVQVRGAAPATVSSALPAGTIAAGSEPTAVLGIDMQDSGRGFAPRFPFGQAGGVVVEAVSKNLAGGVYAEKLVYTLAGQTLTWNDGVAVPVADGRYILEGQAGDFVVVAVIAAELPAANDSVDVTVSADVDRDIQQPAAIRGVRVHGVGPGNVVGNTGTLSLSGTMLSWNSDTASRAAGAPVDVAVPGVYVLNSERVSEADYLMVQVDSIRGAATEDLDIYPADGRAVTPLRTITGLEIMTVSDVVDEGNYDFTWDGTSSLSWSDGSPTNVTDADRPTLVPGNAEGTRFVVVRRTGAPLPAVAAKDRLFVNQTRLLRVYVTVNDNGGFTSTHLKPLAADESSGVALYRDANANGIFDGPGIDEFVPLLQTPVFSGVGSYTTTLYPDPAYRAAYLPNSHVAPHTGNDFFLAVQTTYDMSFGDRFSVSASVYEPTEPRDDLNGNPSFASGSSGTITSTSVTNTVFSDETTSPWTIDAGRNGVAAPQVLFGIDHFLGTTGVIHVQSLTFKLRSANGFDPDIDLKAMDEANPALRGVMLYADNGNGNFSTADTLIPCDIVTDYDAAAGIYTFTLLPIASNSATQVPVTSDGGSSDHFVCLNFAPGLDYGDELYCTVEVDGIEYSSGVGNAAARLQTHNLTATIKSTYGDLTSRVQTTVAGGLLVTDIGSTVANGYHQAQVFFDPDTNAYYLSWNGNVVEIDMLAVESYTLGTGNNSITVTFDPFAFCAEDTLVDGDGTTTDAAGVPDDATRGAALLPLFTVSNPAFAIGSLYYVDTDENGAWDAGEAIVLAVNAGAAFDDGTDGVILGSPAAADPLTAFGPADHLAVHDADGNGDYNDGEDIVRDTDGVYTLPCLDQLIDTDGVATAGTGGATLLVQGDELVSAHTVSVDAGAAVLGYAGLYYYDADGSGGYTPGDDIVARPAVGGVIVGPLVSVATDEVLHDGDDNGDGDDDDVPNDEVQVQVGDSLSQFVAEDYVAFERGGILPDGYELREDIFRARSETFAPTDFTWNFRVTNGSRAIRRYEAAAPVPFRDPEDAMTAVVGIDLANSGATGVTLDRLTLRFDNLYQFNATIDLRALSTGRAYAGRDAGVLLYRDADGNGLFDPEIDTLIQPASAPAWTSSGTEYRVTFNLDSDNLVDDEDMDGIYDFFAVVQPSAAANNYQQVDDGDRFRVRVRNGDMVLSKALNVTSITSDTLVIDSLPPQLSLEADINDADADGYLGSVAFIFHEALQPGNEDAGDWTITDADGSSDLSPTLDSQLGLSTDYRTLTLALADSEGTTGKINCRTTYDADALGLLDWAGNPVDFTAAGATSADDVPPLILHSGIVLDAGWSLDGRAVPAVGIHGGLWYHDRNNNGQWDAGEDIWADRPGGTPGQYDDGIDRRVWNGGDAWTTVDGYSQWAKQDGLYCFDANGDTLWNADENIWVDRDTDTLDGEDDLDGMGEYDQNTDERIFVHRGEEVSVVDLDQNGRVDALEVVLSEVVDPSTVPGYSNHWTNFISQTWYLPARTALQVDPNGPLDQAASAMDGRHLYFIFNELAADQYDTGATPDLVTLNAQLEDLEGNPLNGGSDYQAGDVTVDDQALPVLVSARGDAAIVGGNILAGTRVTLTFSEQMAAYTELAHADFVTDPDGSGPEPAATAFEQKDATLSIDGQGRVVITFNVDTDGGTWTENLTIGINPGRDDYCVGDTVGHNLAEGGAPVQIRGMGSILVTEVLTLDTDGSGFIDAMRVTFDRNIDDSTLAGYGGADVLIDVADNDDHFRVAGRDGFVFIDPNGPFDNDPTGDNVLYLVFAPEGDIPDTGTTPLLTIADDCSLRSFDNEPVDVSSVPLSTDGAAPQIMDVSAYDQDGDGSVETVRLDFSEPIADGTVVPADYFIGGHAALAMDSIRLRTVTGVDNLDGTFTYTFGTLVRHGLKAGDQINIGGGPYGVASALSLTSFTVVTATDLSAMAGTDAAIVSNDDSAIFLSTAPGDQAPGTAYQTVAYTQNFVLAPPAGDADTADAVGNLLADRADAGLRDRLDYAPPVVLAASSLSDRSLQVSFSEVVTVPTLDTVSVNTLAPIAFDSVDAAANPVLVFAANNATWNTGATGLDGDAASGTDSEGAPEGDIRTDLRFAPAAVRDISTQANPLAGVDFAGTTDGTAPVVIRVATSDMGPDGNVDRAMVTFSEQVQNVLAGQFRLGGVAVETATSVDNYEWTFDVFAADQAPGTAYAQLDYLGGICDDLAGNLLPDSAAGMADLGLVQVDGAGPRLLRVSTVDDRTVQVFFSEPLVNSADEIGVAVTNGEFILQVARAAMQFGEALVDDGTGLLVPTGGQGDLASFLLRMTDGTTWNTDATGADAGVGFDATGNQQAVLPQVHASAGVLQDAAGNPLAAAAFVGTTDGAPPVVVEVTTASSQRNNIFGADDNVFVKAIFSEALAYDVAGGLGARLTLQTGAGPSATANVFSTLLENDDDAGTVVGLDRTLAFTYTVVNGDNRVYSVPGYFEYAATDSLIANGAVIADALGNVADLALPTIAPDGDGNSLSRAKVELDTLPPEVASARTMDDNTVELTFNEPVTGASIIAAIGQIRLSGTQPYDTVSEDTEDAIDLTPGTNYTTVYLHVTGAAKRWRTDATGTSAGGVDSTDGAGLQPTNLPQVDIVGGVLEDRPGNTMLPAIFVDTTDGAPPVPIAGAYRNDGADARVNVLEVLFSEPVALISPAGWTLDPKDLPLDLLPADLTGVVTQLDERTLAIAVTANGAATGVNGGNEPELSFAAPGLVQDLSPATNALPAFAGFGLSDEAGPVLLAAGLATPSIARLNFSEKLDGATVDPLGTDFDHSLSAVTASVTVDAWASARVTLDPVVAYGVVSTIRFATGVESITDAAGNLRIHVADADLASYEAVANLTGPANDVMHRGAVPIEVTGLVAVGNVAPEDDLDSWSLYLVQGHAGARLPVGDASSHLLAGPVNTPLSPEGALGNFTPETHAIDGLYEYTLVLDVAFNGSAPLQVYREVFIAKDVVGVGVVNDGPAADIAFQESSTELAGNWAGIAVSGVTTSSYEVAYSEDAASFPAVWTPAGPAGTSSFTIDSLALVDGATYYFKVRALDDDGNIIAWQTSDGVTVDLVGPAGDTVRDGTDASGDLVWQVQNLAFAANWNAFVDPGSVDVDPLPASLTGSGVASYEMAVYQMAGAVAAPTTDPQVSAGFVNVGDVLVGELSVAAGNLATLEHGSTYYAAVRAVDAVGNAGAPVYSDGTTVDLNPPVAPMVTDGAGGMKPAVYVDLVNLTDLRAYWVPFTDDVSGPPDHDLMYQSRVVSGTAPTPWVSGSNMNTARQHFTPVRLADDRLLVAGGWTGNRPLASVEIFDPATGVWTLAAPMNTARMNAAGVCLPDGRVVIGGGEDAEVCLPSIEIYDPATDTWTAAGTLANSRTQAAVTLDPTTGAVWFMGGRDGDRATGDLLASVEAFTPPVAPETVGVVVPITHYALSEARWGAKAVTLADGRILVIAGETGTSTVSATVDIYDPNTGLGSVETLATGRSQFAVCAVPGGNQVIVLGGRAGSALLNSVELFDGMGWSSLAPMGSARYAFGAAWIDGASQVLVTGGYGTTGNLASCEAYDPATGLWAATNPLVTPRGYHQLASFGNGFALAYGGLANYSFVKACNSSRFTHAVTDWHEQASNQTDPYVEHTFTPPPGTLVDGATYYAQVRATDTAGNTSAVVSSTGMVGDFSQPSVAVVAPAGPTNVTTLPFVVTFSKHVYGFGSDDLILGNATVETPFANLDGTVFEVRLNPVVDGHVTLKIAANGVQDLAGYQNTESNEASVEYLGVAGPTCVVALGGGHTTPTRISPISLTATFSHAVTGFVGAARIAVANGIVTSAPVTADGIVFSFEVTPSAEGQVTIQVQAAAASDVIGNDSQASNEQVVVYDITAPVAELANLPANPSNSPDLNVTVAGTGVATYVYSLDAGAEVGPVAVAAPVLEAGLAEGEHTLEVWGIDALGNRQAEPTDYTWTIDLVAPGAALTSLSGTTTFENPIRFRMVFDEDVADFADSSLVVNGTVVDFVAVSASEYTFGVQPTVVRGVEMAVTVTLPADTVHDLAGNACAGTEQVVQFHTEPPARVTLVASAAEVAVGETFQVMVYVKELSAAASGFRGGPLDLQFSAVQAQLDPAAAFDDEGGFDPEKVLNSVFTGDYTSGSLDGQAGLIDELGGASTADNLGEGVLPDESVDGVLYATIPFVATAPGAFKLAAAAAEAGLTLTPPVGNLPVELVDYGQEITVQVTTSVTVTAVGDPRFVENGGVATVLVSAGQAAAEDVTVELAFAGGTAVLGTDYVASATTVVIAAGSSSATITLTGIGNGTYEGSKTVEVSIASVDPVAYQATGPAAELTILESDAPGDLAGNDGKVDFLDFIAFSVHFGTSIGQPGYDAMADLNHDGVIDFYDFNIFVGLYGTDYTTRRAVPAATASRGPGGTAEIVLVAPAEVEVGDVFTVDVFVQTNESNGIAGCILDLVFPVGAVSYSGAFDSGNVIQSPPFNNAYTNGALLEVAGIIDELGGATLEDGVGYTAPVLFAKLEFEATAIGVATFQSAAADASFQARITGEIPLANTTFGSVSVTVLESSNGAPVADDLQVETEIDTAVSCALTATDPDDDILEFSLPETGAPGYPENGTIAASRDGFSAVYTPHADFAGIDQFTFSVSDGLASDVGTVTVLVGGFGSQLTILRDGGQPYTTLTYGRKVGASEDGLVADGDLPAPVQPDGSGAYFQVAEGAATELSADFHPLASTVWKLTVAVPPTVRRGTWQVTWDGTGLPSVGDALLMPCTAAWETSGEKIDLRTAGTLNVTNDGVDVLAFHFLVVVSERVDVTYNLSDGWNLIGVPLDADADSIAAFLADQAVWTVYGWTEAGGYTVASTLKPGRGYWVYVLGDDVTLTLSGIPQVGGVALTAGWNLVSLGGDGTQDPRGAYEAVLSSWLWNPASLRYSAPPQGGIPATSGVWVLVDEDTVIWSNR